MTCWGGDNSENKLYGLGGNDRIWGGGGGDDFWMAVPALISCMGERGLIHVSYINSDARVYVNLIPDVVGRWGDAQGDLYTQVENVTGSAYNDVLTGSMEDNVLIGGQGRRLDLGQQRG